MSTTSSIVNDESVQTGEALYPLIVVLFEGHCSNWEENETCNSYHPSDFHHVVSWFLVDVVFRLFAFQNDSMTENLGSTPAIVPIFSGPRRIVCHSSDKLYLGTTVASGTDRLENVEDVRWNSKRFWKIWEPLIVSMWELRRASVPDKLHVCGPTVLVYRFIATPATWRYWMTL
jgi:hypothetical protein